MMPGVFVLLGVFVLFGDASKVEDTVQRTEQLITKLEEEARAAKQQFANTSKFDGELDKIGQREEGEFDAKLYSEKQQAFATFARIASEKANLAASAANESGAEDALDASRIAIRNMTVVGDEINALEKNFTDKLKSSLDAKLDPKLSSAESSSKNASHLQHEAHSMMNPLYSMGDAAEDKADRLNDEINDAYSSVAKVVRVYSRHISEHAREVQRSVERKLFSPSQQERISTQRDVRRLVQGASARVDRMKGKGDAGDLSVGKGTFGHSTMLLLIIFVAAAAVGAFTITFVRKSHVARGGDYQLLAV